MCEMYDLNDAPSSAEVPVLHSLDAFYGASMLPPHHVTASFFCLRPKLVPARQIQLFLARRPARAPAEHSLDRSKIVGLQTTVKIVALPARYGVAGAFWSPRKNAGQAGSFKSNRHTLQGRRVREEVGSIASIAIDLPLIAKLALRPHQFAVCYVERNTQ